MGESAAPNPTVPSAVLPVWSAAELSDIAPQYLALAFPECKHVVKRRNQWKMFGPIKE